jgi:hypothetical protein
MLGDVLIRGTIYTALVCLAWRLALELRSGLWGWKWSQMRWVWTIGCVAFVCHVLSAFQFRHHWSHADALRVTAERTYEMLGFRFGEGIYFSYIFTLLWIADVAWMWFAASAYQHRARGLSFALLGYLAFIAFNGAVVFESHSTRWVGLPVVAGLVVLFIRGDKVKG